MKNSVLLICLLSLLACDKERIDRFEEPLQGTYNVTHLTQYQNGQLVFESDLPARIGGKTIQHAVSISLSKSKSSATNAFATCAWNRTQGNYTVQTGSSFRVNYQSGQRYRFFDFYGVDGNLLGMSDGRSMSFDYTVPDSLGHPTRFVYSAKKVSAKQNYFTFNY